MKTQCIARTSFFFYISIFLLMLLFESQRFGVFFERESSKIPQLSIVSAYIEKVSNATGISAIAQKVGQVTKHFSQEYIVNTEIAIGEQLPSFISHYVYEEARVDADSDLDINSVVNMAQTDAVNTTCNSKNESGNIQKKQAGLDTASVSALPSGVPSTSNISPSEALSASADSSLPSDASITVPEEARYGKMPEYDIIEEALFDENMTASILAKQKEAYLKSLENTQNTQNTQSTEKKSKKETSFAFMQLFSKKQNTPSQEQSIPYYNAKNSIPAPTDSALREYKSALPDYGKKLTVLIVGDSMMMEGLGPTLQVTLRKQSDLNIIREGRYSSGLSRPDFFNWPMNLSELIKKHNPQLIVVSMGANDTQDIVINKKRHFIDTKSWERVYGIRTYQYLNLAAADNREVLWVSLPVMVREPYFTRTKRISKIQAEVSSYFDNVTYVNIEGLLTEKGTFASFTRGKNNKAIRLRQKDDIHVSQAGGQILTNSLLPQIRENIENIRLAEVANAPLPPVSGQASHVAFTSELRKKETEYIIYLPQSLEAVAKNSKDGAINPVLGKNKVTQSTAMQGKTRQIEVSEKTSSMQELIKETIHGGEERFPVLYLLHGAYDSGEVWNGQMGKELQKIADEKRVIIVAPSGEPFGWYVDSPIVVQNQIESFLIKELIPHIDTLYPTNKKRAIAGLSMGGHGAMLLGFKYPKIFPSVASASGVLDIRLHPNQWQIKDLLGNYNENQKVWDDNSVAAFIGKKWQKYAPQQILIVTGTEDTLVLEDNRLAKNLLEKRKFTFEYNETIGNHDWKFWNKEIPILLRKQADYLNNMNEK